MYAIFLVGVSASGKSTLTKHLIEEGRESFDTEFVEINRDNIRFSLIDPYGSWKTYKFTKMNEDIVTETWEKQLRGAILNNKNVILSDTNLNQKYLTQNIDYLKEQGYTVVVQVMRIPVEICIERDKQRGDFSVGKDVIEKQQKSLDSLLENRSKWSDVPFYYVTH